MTPEVPGSIALLGPQRLQPTLGAALRTLGVPDEARIATVTAGWQEREPDDRDLDEYLGGRATNLFLYARGENVFQHDRELEAAHHRRQDILRRLQSLYAVQLRHAMEACQALLRQSGDDRALEDARAEAIDNLAALDARHLARLRDVHDEYEGRFRPLERAAVVRERDELAAIVRDAGAVTIAGGHVAVLLNRLRLFGLAEWLPGRPVVAWSAGAMAVSERVVLFHDHPPHGAGWAEVLESGLGLAPAIVPFPHAKRRLDLDDVVRVTLSARRFAPASCVALDDGAGLWLDGGRWVATRGEPFTIPPRRLEPRGTLDAVAA